MEAGRIFWRKLEEYRAAVGIILAETGRKLDENWKNLLVQVGGILAGSWKTNTLDIILLIFLRHVAQFDFRCELWR